METTTIFLLIGGYLAIGWCFALATVLKAGSKGMLAKFNNLERFAGVTLIFLFWPLLPWILGSD